MNSLTFHANGDIRQRIDQYMLLTIRLLLLIVPVSHVFGRGITDIACSLTGVLFLISSALRRDWQWLNHWWIRLFIALWLYMMAVSFLADEPMVSLARAATFLRFGAFAAALGYWVLADEKWQRYLFWACVITVLYLVLEAFIQRFLGQSLYGDYSNSNFGGRIRGPFERPHLGAQLLTYGLIIAIAFFAGYQKKLWLFWAGIGVLPLIVIVLTGDRSPFLLAGFGVFLAIVLCPAQQRKKLLAPLVLAALGAGILLIYDSTVFERQIISIYNRITNFQDFNYWKIWQDAFGMIANDFAFGVGGKHFRIECAKEEFMNMYRCHNHPHNLYLDMATEFGMVGLSLFVACLFMVFRQFYKTASIWRADPLALALICASAAKLWPLIGSSSLFANWFIIPFWLGLGWAIARVRLLEQAHKDAI